MPLGSIHGRFQPFHNGHLAYALSAFKRVAQLYIGLTRVLTESDIDQEVAPHRFSSQENPLSYFQRAHVIRRALVQAGISSRRFEIGPFPIEVPSRLPEFWPLNLPCFTTSVAAWNAEKIKILTQAGHHVTVLDDLELTDVPVANGSQIRSLFRSMDPSWQKYVPEGTRNCLLSEKWLL